MSPYLLANISLRRLGPSSKLTALRWAACSVCFAFTGNLALDLFSEFQRILDFLEHFGSATGPAHDYRSVAEDPSRGGLVDDDAFDSGEEDFGRTAFREAGLYDDSLVGDGHLRDIALQQADAKESGSHEKANESTQILGAARRHAFGSCLL